MAPSQSPDTVIASVVRLVAADQRSEIRLKANGGNSIVITCDPMDELEYIRALKNDLSPNAFEVIDLESLLFQFVKKNRETIESDFELMSGSVNQIFKAPRDEETPDFFKDIISAVGEVLAEKKSPVLVNSGVLYGTGINNSSIMEHDSIINAENPLILLYPSTNDGDQLLFLGKRMASRYRCVVLP